MAVDGPLFVAVIVTVPEVPGVIVGDDTVVTTSAERAPTVTVVGAVELFVTDGSEVAELADADPPLSVPGAEAEATTTRIETVEVPPTAIVPATVQVTVPVAVASVQPVGSVPTVTPAGGM